VYNVTLRVRNSNQDVQIYKSQVTVVDNRITIWMWITGVAVFVVGILAYGILATNNKKSKRRTQVVLYVALTIFIVFCIFASQWAIPS
jgi:formate-dependent nitrite reductase membrane component NrfD